MGERKLSGTKGKRIFVNTEGGGRGRSGNGEGKKTEYFSIEFPKRVEKFSKLVFEVNYLITLN